MANFYTKASFVLPLTSEQADFALEVLNCITDAELDFTKKHKNKAGKAYDNDVYRLAKKFAKTCDDFIQGEFYLGFEYEKFDNDPKGIWISSDESIDTGEAAEFCHLILKHFDSDDYVSIEAAHTCSKLRLDAFGGHAAFVTKKGIKYFSTFEWIGRQVNHLNKAKAA